jgi:hypothetical protein
MLLWGGLLQKVPTDGCTFAHNLSSAVPQGGVGSAHG